MLVTQCSICRVYYKMKTKKRTIELKRVFSSIIELFKLKNVSHGICNVCLPEYCKENEIDYQTILQKNKLKGN